MAVIETQERHEHLVEELIADVAAYKTDVDEDLLRRQRSLGAAGARDDAVGAEERAAVLHLDEGSGPLDGRAVVRDTVD